MNFKHSMAHLKDVLHLSLASLFFGVKDFSKVELMIYVVWRLLLKQGQGPCQVFFEFFFHWIRKLKLWLL